MTIIMRYLSYMNYIIFIEYYLRRTVIYTLSALLHYLYFIISMYKFLHSALIATVIRFKLEHNHIFL